MAQNLRLKFEVKAVEIITRQTLRYIFDRS